LHGTKAKLYEHFGGFLNVPHCWHGQTNNDHRKSSRKTGILRSFKGLRNQEILNSTLWPFGQSWLFKSAGNCVSQNHSHIRYAIALDKNKSAIIKQLSGWFYRVMNIYYKYVTKRQTLVFRKLFLDITIWIFINKVTKTCALAFSF
jgi:hypothetical protein